MRKAIVYASSTFVATLATVLTLALLKNEASYVISYGVLSAVGSWLIASTVWHFVMGTWSVKIVCSKVWLAIAAVLWGIAIQVSKWDPFTALMAFVAVGCVNWCGFRWISGDDSVVFADKKVEKLSQTMLFKVDADGNGDHDAPLCLIEGVPVTPAEARERGYVEMADKAIEYIRTIV